MFPAVATIFAAFAEGFRFGRTSVRQDGEAGGGIRKSAPSRSRLGFFIRDIRVGRGLSAMPQWPAAADSGKALGGARKTEKGRMRLNSGVAEWG